MDHDGGDRAQSSFSRWMRTGIGRWTLPGGGNGFEVKFNPWHDPDNSRFTFVGRGRYFPRGNNTAQGGREKPSEFGSPKSSMLERSNRGRGGWGGGGFTGGGGGSFGGGGATGSGNWPATRRSPPASTRPRSARPERPSAGRRLPVGNTRAAAPVPKLAPQPRRLTEASGQRASARRVIRKNDYDFEIEQLGSKQRVRHAKGSLQIASAMRSRREQARAGGPDRRVTDDGGHLIAARFNGPSDWFNHFAQDASFNRGEYRALEDAWAKGLRAGHRVSVNIVPHYRGFSTRPYKLSVTWEIDGKRLTREFRNERKGK